MSGCPLPQLSKSSWKKREKKERGKGAENECEIDRRRGESREIGESHTKATERGLSNISTDIVRR